MTRFYSEYEIQKQDKQLNEDLMLSNERFKDELKVAINEDNHRSNVDRAKKKAVTQFFDYDKFHQMVLGADLKGMKMDDVIQIKPDKAILNPVDDIQKFKSKDFLANNFVAGKEEKKIEYLENEEMTIQRLGIEFKKITDLNEKINFLFKIGTNKFKVMLQNDNINSDLFSGLILNIGLYLNDKRNNIQKEIFEFCLELLELLENSSFYSKLKMFIGKKHKKPYEDLLSFNNENKFITIQNHIDIINKIITK